MYGLDAGPLAVNLYPGIGRVDLDVLDATTGRDDDGTLPGSLEALQNFVFDLHVPGIVVLTGLEDRACCRDCIPAPLQLYGVKIGPVWLVVCGVSLADDHVARLEIVEPVRTG